MQHFLRSVRFGSMAARRALWLTALFAALARTVVLAAGPVVRCEPCDAGALGQCKPLPRDCTERVREPGCGCCLTCALREGQTCGVYTGRCGAGLRCLHRPGESKPLHALLEGRGVCTSAKKPNTSVPPVPPLKTGKRAFLRFSPSIIVHALLSHGCMSLVTFCVWVRMIRLLLNVKKCVVPEIVFAPLEILVCMHLFE